MTATTIPLFGDETPSAPPPRRPRRGPAGASPSTEAPTPDCLLTIAAAAELLGVGRSKLYELVGQGVIASVKIDRCRRIRRSDIDRFIAALPAAFE